MGIRYISNDEFDNVYNAAEIKEGDLHILKNIGWNQDIPAKGIIEFGYTQNYDKNIDIPNSFDLVSVEQLVETNKYSIDLIMDDEWNDEANAKLIINNNSDKVIKDWRIKFNSNFEILDIWNAELVQQNDKSIILMNAEYVQNILPKEQCIVGIHIKENGKKPKISECVLSEVQNEVVQKEDKKILDIKFGVSSVLKDSDTNCEISAKTNGDANDEVKLYVKENNDWSFVGDLYDSGNLIENNDEIRGDGVYTNIFPIKTNLIGNVQYKISLLSSGIEVDSVIKEVQVIEAIDLEEYIKYRNDITDICDKISCYIENKEYVYDNTVDEVIENLKTSIKDFSKIEKVNGSSLIITFNNGLNFTLQFSDKSDMKTMIRGGGNSATFENEQEIGVAMTRSRNILYWAPFDSAWGDDDETEVVKRIVKDSAYSEDLTIVNDSNADVESLNNLTNYGLIILATHGIGGKWIVTGEKLGKASEYLKELSMGQLSTYVDFDPSDKKYDLFYMTNEEWFKNSLENIFPNSIIINNSCESTKTNILWDTFKEMGAKTYYGNNGAVTNRYATDRCKYLLNELLVNKVTTEDAYDKTFDTYYGSGAGFVVRGQGNLVITDCLNNSCFENSYYWNSYGDYRVVSNLGSISAPEGNMMGMISTGIGNTQVGGGIYQTVALPKTAKSLYFDWNFISAEFLEYINSEFDDPFQVKITCMTSSEKEKVIFNRSVNSLAETYGATKDDSGRLICVSPEIVLNDYDDIWMTGWDSACVNVSNYAGQTIKIEFTVANAADTNYPTAVLLDNIHFDSEYTSTDDYKEVSVNEYNEENNTGKSYLFYIDEFASQAEAMKNKIHDEYAYVNDKQIKMNLVKSENDFKESWNSMAPNIGEEKMDEVVIIMHGTYYALIIDDALNEDNTEYINGHTPENLTVSKDRKTTTDANATYIGDLISKNIDTLRIYSCNTGLLDAINVSMDKKMHPVTNSSGTYKIEGNVAQCFLANNNVRRVIAYDGSVGFDDDGLPRLSYDEGHYLGYLEDLEEIRKIKPYRYEGTMSDFGFEYIYKNGFDSILEYGVMPNGEVTYYDTNEALYYFNKLNTGLFGFTYKSITGVEVDLNTNEQRIIQMCEA